ncbi:MAG: conjugal transfer protein TraX [Lachnospiraceae bacterium]|nr:conjugal transfer protein TraX [Lachnospiraceae bacterium]
MEKKKFGLSSSTLHILAMALMLCDHMCMTLFGNQHWLHYVGRIAYPIFAFMLVEGFIHTSNLKKYLLRLFCFALISEIPFDLMCGGTVPFVTQQNVLFTFILSIFAMLLMEQPKKIKKPVAKYIVFAITAVFATVLGFLLGTLTMVDYFGGGVVIVIIFYLFQGDKILSFKVDYKKEWMRIAVLWVNRAIQALLLWNVFCEMIGGLCTNITVFGKTFEVVVEAFGILALIPIWLYNGERGYKAKWFKYFNYAFYPAHIMILWILMVIL